MKLYELTLDKIEDIFYIAYEDISCGIRFYKSSDERGMYRCLEIDEAIYGIAEFDDDDIEYVSDMADNINNGYHMIYIGDDIEFEIGMKAFVSGNRIVVKVESC